MTTKEQVKEFVDYTRSQGWSILLPNDRPIVTIFKSFSKESVEEYSAADSEYFDILAMVPTTSPGSMWGTDGGGVGGISALNRGEFIMNKSGVSKRFTTALRKYLLNHPDLNICV